MKTFVLIAAMLSVGTAAFAAPWVVENDKGLLVHRLDASPLKLMMLCDPDGAWIPPLIFMKIGVHGQNLENGKLAVQRGDETVTLDINHGGISARDRPDEWNKAVSWMLDGGTVDLTAGGKTVTVAASEPMQNTCLIK